MTILTAKNHLYLSENQDMLPTKLGINGSGRIGKMTVWHHVSRQSFQGIVLNIGREVGRGLEDVADYLERDSTYGSLARYIHGFRGQRVIEALNEKDGSMLINGIPVKVLREHRNPKDIGWRQHGVQTVVDCTGVFRDPTETADVPKGSLRGHLAAGAKKVILSAPFKIKDTSRPMPEDALTNIQGINEDAYAPNRHHIISAASCTTTCLAFMVKALLDHFGHDPILSASMVTVHATTGTQEILDQLPAAGSKDLRKNRSIFNNIILTTTGAAEALGLVIPEMKKIDFMAASVRIPINTGSIVILVLNIQNEDPENAIDAARINDIYRKAADGYLSKFLTYTESQNVSADIIGTVSAAIIEGKETRARTGQVKVNLGRACRIVTQGEPMPEMDASTLEIPVTHVVVNGWYDNELGSFSHILGETTIRVAKSLVE